MDDLEPHEDQMQQLFALAQVLTQDRQAAQQLMLPTLHRAARWRARVDQRAWYRLGRTPVARHRWDPPAATRYQIGLYEVTEAWEKQREAKREKQQEAAWENQVEFDIRYIKYLVYSTLIRGAPYVATGIGSRLYRYSLNQIDKLVEPIFAPEEPRYFRKRIDKQLLKQRFPQLNPRSTRDTSAAERSFVYRLSGFLAPWGPHPNTQTPLRDHFGQSSPSQEGEQIHILIDMDVPCKGWTSLITDYNSTMHRKKGKMLPDPDSQLKLPQLPALPSSGGPAAVKQNPTSAPPSTDPFATTPLSPQELDDIKDSFQLLQRRLTRYSPGLLSVEVDGKRRGEFDIQTQQTLRLRVPNYASNIEVYGHDDEGPLLLAVFSVASIASSAVGRTATFLLSAAHQEDRLPSHTVVQLTYLESPLAAVRAWCVYSPRQLCERIWEWWRRVGTAREPGVLGHLYLRPAKRVKMASLSTGRRASHASMRRWAACGAVVVIAAYLGVRHWEQIGRHQTPLSGPSPASVGQSTPPQTLSGRGLGIEPGTAQQVSEHEGESRTPNVGSSSRASSNVFGAVQFIGKPLSRRL